MPKENRVKIHPVWEAISKKLLGIETVPFREKERMIKRAGKAAYEAAKQDLTWYLLYGGTSTDGRGDPKFKGRTTDSKEALKFFKETRKSPYDIGRVIIITETTKKVASDESCFS